jgi:hypothetical protein
MQLISKMVYQQSLTFIIGIPGKPVSGTILGDFKQALSICPSRRRRAALFGGVPGGGSPPLRGGAQDPPQAGLGRGGRLPPLPIFLVLC